MDIRGITGNDQTYREHLSNRYSDHPRHSPAEQFHRELYRILEMVDRLGIIVTELRAEIKGLREDMENMDNRFEDIREDIGEIHDKLST